MTDNLPGVLPVAQNTPNNTISDGAKAILHGDELGVGTESNIDDNQLNNHVGSMNKEQMESGPSRMSETAPIVELKEDEKIPEQVESWIEKLEKGEEIKLPQPVTHDDQVLVQNVGDDIKEDSIVLPMSESEMQKGLHKKVYSSARWLAEWCAMVAKKLHGKVAYQPEEGSRG